MIGMRLPCTFVRHLRQYRVSNGKREDDLAATGESGLSCGSAEPSPQQSRDSRMRANSRIRSVLAVLLLTSCAPTPAPPVDSPAFARRAPLPGQPGYLETIRYIADGLNYVSAGATFFISSRGEMCFQGLPDADMNPYANYRNFWCISPLAVASVDEVRNGVTYANGVRLWCRLSAPQCAHKISRYPNMLDHSWIANSITAETIPFREQRAAIQHLIYLMGGDVGEPEPLAWRGRAALDLLP
jgi:hypothetical protein